ncbi:MAG TPA: sugar phosphate nucleotidyltransferase [archaeon]|nr:sugar phosphate nucleotidyltransferase [archaeon]
MVERITITIKKDVLRRVDSMIDGREIRNRSHAIESLLAKSMSGGLETALIMAGGQPAGKALVPVAGRPALEHHIDMLRSHGITNIVIASDYAEKIRQYFGSGRAYGVEITYLAEDKPLGSAGAIGTMGDYTDGSFLMVNADTLMDPNIHEIYEFHKKQRKLATVMLTTTEDPSHFGVVKMRGNQILRFEEKPRLSADVSRLVNAGLCIFDKKVCSMVPKRKIMIEELFNRLCRQGQLSGFIHDGIALDIGTKEGYERAVREWKG